MAIRDTVGNFTHSFKDTVSSAVTTGRTTLENIVGSTKSQLTNIWSGGFTGMSENGINDLKQQLTNYCKEIQDIIQNFDEKGDIEVALKGEVQQAASDFIAAVKALLQAYVSTMKQGIEEANEAYNNFMQSGQSISQDVNSAASEIRSSANNISLD